jgi:hypothetical protein
MKRMVLALSLTAALLPTAPVLAQPKAPKAETKKPAPASKPAPATAPAPPPPPAPSAEPDGGGVSGLVIGGLTAIGGGLLLGITGLVLARGVAAEDIKTCDGNSVCQTESVVTNESAETAGIALGVIGLTAITAGVVMLIAELALANQPTKKPGQAAAPRLVPTRDGAALRWDW